ncbi:MAG TPA: sulfur carrier protein ThiS [Planctomycetota bacterium]|nr:sulfur carrier protein ThiS [Planctomycetota bacterium]
MVVFVNSKQQTLEDGATVARLIEALGMGQKRVAVEVNTELVTKGEWQQFKLKEGDRIEIVSFVGGG